MAFCLQAFSSQAAEDRPPASLAGPAAVLASDTSLKRVYGPVSVDYSGLLSQHDVVYLTPAIEGRDGLILGDGEAGVRIWNPPDRLMMQLNHSSLWNDSRERPVVDHGARIEIRTGLPLFDWRYLRDYEARLGLEGAEMRMRSAGAMGDARAVAYYSRPHKVYVLEYADATRVATERTVWLERFGSQYFGNFHLREQQPETNLAGTETGSEGGSLWLTQSLGTLRFAVVVRVEPVEAVNATVPPPTWAVTTSDDGLTRASTTPCPSPAFQRLNRHQVAARLPGSERSAFRLLVAIAHNREADDPLELARNRVEAAVKAGRDALRSAHRADWAEQWPRSFVHLPQDRYVENLWYLVQYQNIASRRGLEPPFFIDMTWNWKRDVTAWHGVYLHWNMFSANFPLYAAGRLDLMESYLRWKERQLPHATAFAREVHGAEGACFTDYASFRGEQTLKDYARLHNLTPGPQIALEMYQYWQYTRDYAFLRTRALPFLRETTRFYLAVLKPDSSGTLHFERTNPYEFHAKIPFRDTITDVAHARALFRALVDAERAADAVTPLSARAAEAAGRLPSFQPVPIHPDWLLSDDSGGLVYENRFFKGEPFRHTDRVWATAFSLRDGRWVSHMDIGRDPEARFGVMCGAPTAPVYPAGLIGPDSSPERRGLTGADSPEEVAAWEAMRNALRTLRKFRPGLPVDRVRHADPDLAWAGHSPELPAFARLGLAPQLKTALRTFIDKYQMYPMGLWCYWGWDAWKDAWHERKGKEGPSIRFPSDPRILHASSEPAGIFAAAVQEMLLTSYDGVVRLFPAYEDDATFGLHAVGGFFVSASRIGGRLTHVRVASGRGGMFVLSSPWPSAQAIEVADESSGRSVAAVRVRDRIQFPTTAGVAYVVKPAGASVPSLHLTDRPRNGPRTFERTSLGKARDF